ARGRQGFVCCGGSCVGGRGSSFGGRLQAASHDIAQILSLGIKHKDTKTQGKTLLLCVFVSLCLMPISAPAADYTFRVVKSYPHDNNAFLQGLEYRDGFFYEGTGMAGRSSVRKVEVATGKVVQKFD